MSDSKFMMQGLMALVETLKHAESGLKAPVSQRELDLVAFLRQIVNGEVTAMGIKEKAKQRLEYWERHAPELFNTNQTQE